MLGMKTILWIGILVLLALPAGAQQEPGVLTQLFAVRAKAGMTQQFETALKQHMDWARQNGETWPWYTYIVSTGDRLGEYIIRSPGHRWEDLDTHASMMGKLRDRWIANVAQYVETISSSISAFHPNVSRWPEGVMPPTLASVSRYHLNPGGSRDFHHAIKKVHEAIGKANWPAQYGWLSVVSGGESPTFVLVLPYKSWADMKSPEKSLADVLEEVYGRQDSDAIRESFAKSVHCEQTMVVQHRPDLSYQPAGR